MRAKLFLFLFVLMLSLGSFFSFVKPQILQSAAPTNIKDVLSSSQLSFFGRLGLGVSVNDTVIKVSLVAGTAPSTSSNNLFIGDTLAIGTSGVGTSGPLTIYTVKDIGNTASIQLNAGIGQSNTFAGAAIIATHSAIHTISFTPQSSVTGGYWQFLIKATSRSGEVNNDGIPDQQGFDLGSTTPSSGANGLGTRLKVSDVTCPNWGIGATTAFSVGTTALVNGSYYHVITCYLGVGGTNQIGVGYSAVIGHDLASGSQLINPAPKDGAHSEGNADAYTFYIRHLDNTQAVLDADTAQGKIAVVESVRVTATIDPTLTFTIGVTSPATGIGATPCGIAAGLGAQAAFTTPDSVAFGSLALSSANDLSQTLSCVTNANNGYVVTVYEDGAMKNITTGTTIPDTNCNGGGCSSTVAAAWSSFANSGWGYTLQNINVGTSIFNYQAGYKAFGNGAANAQQIMKNTSTPSSSEVAYICYRIAASTNQESGNYEGKLIYTATATF